MKANTILATLGVFGLLFVGGCSSKETPVTKQDEQQFKGGPMPADARQKVNQAMGDWAKKNSKNGPGAGSGNTPAPAPNNSGT